MALQLSQQQYEEKMQKLKDKIEELLKDAQVTIVPKLHYTPSGIIPIIAFESTDPENRLDEIKV